MFIPIAGIGAISAAGMIVDTGSEAVASGKECIAPLTLFDAQLKQVPLCGQVTREIALPSDVNAPNRTAQLACNAVLQAIEGNNLTGLRIGIVSATTVGGITRSERFYERLRKDPSVLPETHTELAAHEPTALSASICSLVKAQGFHTLSTACSTSLHAVGMAKRFIEQDYYDACIAVGADALSMLTIRGFASLTLLDPNGCRPFDKRRAGISLGEGAGAMLLVSPKVADKFKTIYGYISGWGSSADCHHMTAPHPQGEGAKRAVQSALDEARIAPEEITMIATHGTGTPDNDKAEIKAMQSIFSSLPPFCSMKRTIGHTLAASGIIETIYAIRALQNDIVFPTAGFEIIDDEIGVAPATSSSVKQKHIVKNAFGFGGNNAAIVISKEAK